MDRLIIKAITIFLCVAILSGTGCSINKQNKLEAMVKSGQDPQRAACAIYTGESHESTSICTILANKGI